jgi:dihydrofolate reductase
MSAFRRCTIGRTTYEDFAKVWPNQPKPNPFTEALNNVEKFVASTTLAEPLPWQNSTLLKGDAADAVDKLKKEHDKSLVIFGSGVLVQSLMWRDLMHPTTTASPGRSEFVVQR